jgi:hypothetical protein
MPDPADAPDDRDCPTCGEPMARIDTGYAYLWECARDECPEADGWWHVYDWGAFSRVKEVQREVGQQAAERLAWEMKEGALA